MGPQRETFIQKEGVLHAACRMPRRYPQGREVVVVGLDLGSLGDAIAQADEEVDDVVYNHLGRMQVALRKRDTRQCDVDRFGPQTLLPLARRDLYGPGAEGRLDLERGKIGGPANLLALLGSQGAYALLYLRKLCGAAEKSYADVFEICGRSAGGDGRECFGLQLLDALAHRHSGRLW